MKQDMIVILDLGNTENTTLARAIRSLGVYSEIYPHDITKEMCIRDSSIPDRRVVYVPYEMSVNGKAVPLKKLENEKVYEGVYTINDQDSVLKISAKCRKLGDITNDEKINIIDAQRIANMVASGAVIPNTEKISGDVNFDQKLNIIDAQKIAQYAADINIHF